MEKRTLTSALALTFLMAGTATFAMDDTLYPSPKTKSIKVKLPENLPKGTTLKVILPETTSSDLQNMEATVETKREPLLIEWDNSPTRERFPKKASVKEENGKIILTTDCSEGYLYQRESQSLKDVNPGDALRFSYDIEGEAQGLTLILRNKTHQRPIPGAFFALQKGVNKKQDLQFIIPEGVKDISVLLYNDKKIESTTLTINELKIEKVKNFLRLSMKAPKEDIVTPLVTEEKPVLSEEENKGVSKIPSDDSFFMAAYKMSQETPKLLEILMNQPLRSSAQKTSVKPSTEKGFLMKLITFDWSWKSQDKKLVQESTPLQKEESFESARDKLIELAVQFKDVVKQALLEEEKKIEKEILEKIKDTFTGISERIREKEKKNKLLVSTPKVKDFPVPVENINQNDTFENTQIYSPNVTKSIFIPIDINKLTNNK